MNSCRLRNDCILADNSWLFQNRKWIVDVRFINNIRGFCWFASSLYTAGKMSNLNFVFVIARCCYFLCAVPTHLVLHSCNSSRNIFNVFFGYTTCVEVNAHLSWHVQDATIIQKTCIYETYLAGNENSIPSMKNEFVHYIYLPIAKIFSHDYCYFNIKCLSGWMVYIFGILYNFHCSCWGSNIKWFI